MEDSIEIIPGILEKDWTKIQEKIEIAIPLISSIHVDLIDGKFFSTETFGNASFFTEYSKKTKLELHMMVENPILFLREWADAGFSKFIGHVEKMESQEEFVALGQTLGEVFLALDLETETEAIKVPYDDLDGILLMGVRAGASGQVFNNTVLSKIQHFSSKGLKVEVDGGINTETIKLCKDAGASQFVANSFLFNGDFKKNLNNLRILV